MSVQTGQVIAEPFTTADPTTGAATNADSLPTAVLVVNGADDAAVVTVANVSTGRYTASVTLPTLAAGDQLAIVASATVGEVAGVGVIWQAEADTARAGEVATSLAVVDTVVDAIKAKTDALGSGAVTVVSPVSTTGVWGPLVAGDDYVGTLYVDVTGIDLSGATVVCNLGPLTGLACTVAATATGYRVTVADITAAQTATLAATAYAREFEATTGGRKTTFGRGSVSVRSDTP